MDNLDLLEREVSQDLMVSLDLPGRTDALVFPDCLELVERMEKLVYQVSQDRKENPQLLFQDSQDLRETVVCQDRMVSLVFRVD